MRVPVRILGEAQHVRPELQNFAWEYASTASDVVCESSAITAVVASAVSESTAAAVSEVLFDLGQECLGVIDPEASTVDDPVATLGRGPG